VEIHILGQVRLLTHEPVDLGATKVRGLLGFLSFRANEHVHVDRIAEALWDDVDRPADPAKVLQTYVSRLRRVFRDSGCPATLAHEHRSYRLQVDQSTVDYYAHVSAMRRAHRARGRGDLAEAAELFAAAVGMWSGPPLADLDTVWARRFRDGLVNHDFLPTSCALFDMKLALGDHEFVLNRLSALLADHPTEEQLAIRWVRALVVAGRGGEVLAFFREFTQRLADDLDVPPAPELIQAVEEASRPSLARVAPKPSLPRVTPYFTGRAEPLEQLDMLLAGDDRVALDGPPGVGKTTLAMQWARRHQDRFRDGVLTVDLAGYSNMPLMEPHTVMAEFLAELGVEPERVPQNTAERAALLRRYLSTRRVLVLLDNARDSAHVRPLLAATATCPTLITSRQQLTGIVYRDGVHRMAVPALPPDEAEALLTRRIGDRAAGSGAAITKIVEACQSLPLALRIAAEHVAARPAMPIDELAEELHARRLLDAGVHGDDHTTTLRATFSLSYHALRAEEQRLFRLIGLHPGTRFSVQAASALVGGKADVVEPLLDSLVGAHLVAQEHTGRYLVHDLLHLYASATAEEHEPAGGQALGRLFDWYLESARRARAHLDRDDQDVPALAPAEPIEPMTFADAGAALRWLVDERANLVACTYRAAELGFHHHVWRFAACLNVLVRYESPQELLAIHDLGRQSAERVGAAGPAGGCWNNKGMVQALLGDHAGAARSFETAHQAFVEADDERGISVARHNIGATYLSLRQPAEAITWLTEALAMNARLGSEWAMANSHRRLGDAYRMLDRMADARSHYRQASYASQKAGDVSGQGASLRCLAELSLAEDRLEEAIRYGEVALDAFDRIQVDRDGTAATLAMLARAHLRANSYGVAISLVDEAVRTYRDTRNVVGEIDGLILLGRAHAASGESVRAVSAWTSAGELITSPTDPRADTLRDLLRTHGGQPIPPPRAEDQPSPEQVTPFESRPSSLPQATPPAG
jgi:DNA-binding SARP family transcriptional activator/tetratricopeptide (TPR) repeat protein